MIDNREKSTGSDCADAPGEAPQRELSDAAKRALAEAEARRKARDEAARADAEQREIGGRNGPDPVRYGDWEKDGIISDF